MKNEDIIDTVLFIILFYLSCFFSILLLAVKDPPDPFTNAGFGFELDILTLFICLFPMFIFLIKRKIYAIVLALFIITLNISSGSLIEAFLIEIEQQYTIFAYIWEAYFSILIYAFYLGFKILIREHIIYKNLPLNEKQKLRRATSIFKRISYFFIIIIFAFITLVLMCKSELIESGKWLNAPPSWRNYPILKNEK
jgi:hypothetical protein